MHNLEVILPKSLTEVLEYKSKMRSELIPLAGGTDLLVAHRGGNYKAKKVINLSHIKELKTITLDEKGLHIGALVTFSEIIQSKKITKYFPSLIDSLKVIGSIQIRNLGTLVGNICNGSPAADSLPILYCANASVSLNSLNQEKEVQISKFIVGPGETDLDVDS
ncbi:MAG: FAD binding domain-containing protein, partial [Candidatus Hodarchaeales archaeon]